MSDSAVRRIGYHAILTSILNHNSFQWWINGAKLVTPIEDLHHATTGHADPIQEAPEDA